ncbi:MAG: PEP-CTERM sorting domain-containing protein [Pirellulales bacterium]|nr:PEP-CTERM sorting domain-containing protein [Pirellulales bacterium]
MTKRDTLRKLLLSTGMLGLCTVTAANLFAAPVGSAYRTAVDALTPAHYFPLDEAYGSPAGTLVTNLGASAPVVNEANYIRMHNNGSTLAFNDGTLPQGTGFGQAALVGATVGPTVMSKFTAPENIGNSTNFAGVSQAAYLNQLPGFNPNLGFPGDPSGATGDIFPDAATTGGDFNRAFEGNGRGAIQLNTTVNGNNIFHGDATTGAFTFAGWIRLDSANTSSTIRIFESGGNNGANGKFFQITSGGSAGLTIATSTNAADTRSLKAFYPSGTPAAGSGGTVGGDRGVGDSGQWYFLVVSTSGNTPAERIANLQVWERYADKSNAMGTGGTTLGGSTNQLGVAKLGYRDLNNLGIALATQGASDKMDEISMWNRVLQYDEREALYIAGTKPTSGAPVNTTTADGNWAVGGNWSVGQWPLQHGNNNSPYYAAVIDHNILATTFDNGANGTASFRSNVDSLTVNAGKTLTLDVGTTIRSAEDMTINGNVVMNGDNGVFSTVVNSKDFNFSKTSALDGGRNTTISAATAITMASPSNKIIAEGNLTIQSGATLVVNPGTNLPATGAKLYTIAQADSNAGSGSALQELGALTGTFNTTLNQPVDALGRRFSLLYENRAANGVGIVDTVKVGFALPGDLDFDNDVDFTDAFELTNNYGLGSGATWRQGDFFNDGAVDFVDAFEQTNNFGATYATTEGDFGDNRLTVVYNPITGLLTVDGAPGEIYKSLIIESASGLLNINQAGWLSSTGVGFTQNSPNQQGFASNTALGHTFLIQDGYAIGTLINPGVSQSFLLQDLTIRYGIQGQVGTRTGDFIPEPSTIVLAGLGALGMAYGVYRRRRQVA